MDKSGKRKRLLEKPQITYQYGKRTFDRLFEEETLQETKTVVREKLGLPADADIRLSQLRDDTVVDLEDDRDFEAFYARAYAVHTVTVRVALTGAQDALVDAQAKHVSFSNASKPAAKRRKLNDGKADGARNEDDDSEGDAPPPQPEKKGKAKAAPASTSTPKKDKKADGYPQQDVPPPSSSTPEGPDAEAEPVVKRGRGRPKGSHNSKGGAESSVGPASTPNKPAPKPKSLVEPAPEGESASAPKKRGRPPKSAAAPPADPLSEPEESASAPTTAKKRGRPPKSAAAQEPEPAEESASAPALPKKRGRPPKSAAAPAPTVSEPEPVEETPSAPVKAKRKKVKKSKPVDDGSAADVETDSVNPAIVAGPKASETQPKQRRKSISIPNDETVTPTPNDDGNDSAESLAAAFNTAAKRNDASASLSKLAKKVDNAIASDEPKKKKSGKPDKKGVPPAEDQDPDERAEMMRQAMARITGASAKSNPPPATTPLAPPPATKTKGAKSKDKVNGHSMPPPPPVQHPTPEESDEVPPVAGPGPSTSGRAASVADKSDLDPDDESGTDEEEEEGKGKGKGQKEKKKTKTNPKPISKPVDEDDLDTIMRGPRRPRMSMARVLQMAEREEEEDQANDEDVDMGDVLEEEEEEKEQKRNKPRLSVAARRRVEASSDSESAGSEPEVDADGDIRMSGPPVVTSKATTTAKKAPHPEVPAVAPAPAPAPTPEQEQEPPLTAIPGLIHPSTPSPAPPVLDASEPPDDIENAPTPPPAEDDAIENGDVEHIEKELVPERPQTPVLPRKLIERMKPKSASSSKSPLTRSTQNSQTRPLSQLPQPLPPTGSQPTQLRQMSSFAQPGRIQRLTQNQTQNQSQSQSQSQRLSPPSQGFVDLGKESTQEPDWTVLSQRSPSDPEPDPDMTMEDQLVASSPIDSQTLRSRFGDLLTPLPPDEARPLFFHGESQIQFPFTQKASQSSDEDDEDEGKEVQEVAKKNAVANSQSQSQAQRKPQIARQSLSQPEPFRRLTEIVGGSQLGRFTRAKAQSVTPSGKGTANGKGTTVESMYGALPMDSDSDSEPEAPSHIPKSRRAGVKAKK